MLNVQASGLRVLLVDDATSMRSLLRAIMAQEGHQVVGELASGRGFMDALTQLRPNIVCLDNNLPDATGLELLKLAHEAHPGMSVVLITGDIDPLLEDAAAEAGAAGFIRKPFTPDSIVRDFRQVAHAQRLLLLHKVPPNAAPATAAPVPARARAVIADDSATMRTLLAAILHSAGVEVVGEAWDGEQAIHMVAEQHPDIVCLDLEMPVKNGLEALQAIRSAQPTIKVLMITGRASRDAVMQAGKLGAKGYVLKPFQPEGVVAAINKLLAIT